VCVVDENSATSYRFAVWCTLLALYTPNKPPPHTHTHTHVHTHAHTHTHTHIYKHTHTHTHKTRTNSHTQTRKLIHTHTHAYTHQEEPSPISGLTIKPPSAAAQARSMEEAEEHAMTPLSKLYIQVPCLYVPVWVDVYVCVCRYVCVHVRMCGCA